MRRHRQRRRRPRRPRHGRRVRRDVCAPERARACVPGDKSDLRFRVSLVVSTVRFQSDLDCGEFPNALARVPWLFQNTLDRPKPRHTSLNSLLKHKRNSQRNSRAARWPRARAPRRRRFVLFPRTSESSQSDLDDRSLQRLARVPLAFQNTFSRSSSPDTVSTTLSKQRGAGWRSLAKMSTGSGVTGATGSGLGTGCSTSQRHLRTPQSLTETISSSRRNVQATLAATAVGLWFFSPFRFFFVTL